MKQVIWTGIIAALLVTGCGTAEKTKDTMWRDNVSAQELVQTVADELGNDYRAEAELAPEFLDDWYGISDDMYEEYYGQTPMLPENTDSLIIVKAKQERLEDVENALDTYREAMMQDTLKDPANVAKVQASMIRTYGDYVCFVQLGDFYDGTEENEEELIESCREMNERALAVIEEELEK